MIINKRKVELLKRFIEYVSEHCNSEQEEYDTFRNIIGLSESEMQDLGISFDSISYKKDRTDKDERLLDEIEMSDMTNLEKGIAGEVFYRYEMLRADKKVNFEINFENLKNLATQFMESELIWDKFNDYIDDSIIDLEKESYNEYKKYCMEEYMEIFDKAEYEILYDIKEVKKFQNWYINKIFDVFKNILFNNEFELKKNSDNTYSLVDTVVKSDIENERFTNLVDVIKRLDSGSYIYSSIIKYVQEEFNYIHIENKETKKMVKELKKNIKEKDYNKIANGILDFIKREPEYDYLKSTADQIKLVYYGAEIPEFVDNKIIIKNIFCRDIHIVNGPVDVDSLINDALKDTSNGNFCFYFSDNISDNEFNFIVESLKNSNMIANMEVDEENKEIDIVFYLENCPNVEEDEEEETI